MVTGELTFDDRTTTYTRDPEETICIDMDCGEVTAYTFINKEQAQKIVEHLNKVFELDGLNSHETS